MRFKKTLAGIGAGAALAAGTVATSTVATNLQIQALPVAQHLKADPSNIIAHRAVGQEEQYAYKTNTVLPPDTNERIALRNTKTRTYHVGWTSDGREKVVAQSGFLQYQDHPTGAWKAIEIATTTVDAFDLQTKPTLLQSAGNLLGQIAHAADTGTTAAGTGSSIDESVLFGPGTAWTNPTNVAGSDNVYATSPIGATSFYFCGSTGVVYTYETIFLSGAPIGTRKNDTTCFPSSDTVRTVGSSSDVWGTSLTAADVNDSTFGGGMIACNSKGCDYTISKWIVGSNFGFAIAASSIDGLAVGYESKADTTDSGNAYVDNITMRVYYTIAAGGGSTPLQDESGWFSF